jgi:hypothetical protein
VKRKNPLHSYTAGNLADGEGLAESAVFTGDHDAYKDLDTLPGAFLDLHMHPDRIAGTKIGEIAPDEILFDKI